MEHNDGVLFNALMEYLCQTKGGKRRSFAIKDGQVLGNFTPAEKEAIYQRAAELDAAVVVPGRKRVAAAISAE